MAPRVAGALTMGKREAADLDQCIGVALGQGAAFADGLTRIVDRVGDIEITQRGIDDGGIGGFELAGEYESTLEDPVEMQTGGWLIEVFGAVGVGGAFHPLADGHLGLGDIEPADDFDD